MAHGARIKTGAVVLGAMVLASIVVRGADVFTTPEALVGGVAIGKPEVCPEGMTLVTSSERQFCIDRYEVSPGAHCFYDEPENPRESLLNLREANCVPTSREGAVPWRYISQIQAVEACTKAGKRLPTALEWYRASIGTPEGRTSCVLEHSEPAPARTGSRESCASAAGAFDMVGNVWEWVDEEVVDGVWQGKTIAATGYVHAVDRAGVALSSGATSSELYGADRVWAQSEGVMGMLRGGYYKSGMDGGIYALYAASPLSFAGTAVGFRCVRDLTRTQGTL